MSNDTTRKYPRTLESAFGPYTSHAIETEDPPYDWQDRVIIAAGAVTVVGLLLIILDGWMA